jgi:hypothetical protein
VFIFNHFEMNSSLGLINYLVPSSGKHPIHPLVVPLSDFLKPRQMAL